MSGTSRKKMAEAINTQRHLHRIGAAETDICQCCGLQTEDMRHMCVECPSHAHIRLRSGIPAAALSAAPECLSLHGLLPEGWLQNIEPEDRRDTVTRFQYMLLDILQNRNEMVGVQPPVPRWKDQGNRGRG